jgi:hypothetical protein
MTIRRMLLRLLAMAMLCAVVPARAGESARLPTAAFARLPMVDEVALSPDGQRYAALMNVGHDTVLVTRTMTGGQPLKAVLNTDNRKFQFGWIGWVNNERLLLGLRFPNERGWVGVVETRLLSVRYDGSELRNLVRRPSGGRLGSVAQFQDRVVDWLPEDGHHILLQLVDEDDPLPSVFRVNVETGQRSRVQMPRPHVWGWLTDRTHRVRVASAQNGTRIRIDVCDPDGSRWRTAWSYELLDRQAVHPLGFGDDPNLLYVLADHEGREAVFTADLSDPKLPLKLVLADPHQDLGGRLVHDPKTGRAVGISSTRLGEGSASFWDPVYKALLASIDKALPERASTGCCSSRQMGRDTCWSPQATASRRSTSSATAPAASSRCWPKPIRNSTRTRWSRSSPCASPRAMAWCCRATCRCPRAGSPRRSPRCCCRTGARSPTTRWTSTPGRSFSRTAATRCCR